MTNPEVNINVLRDAVEWVEWQNELDISKRSWNQDVWYVDVDKRLNGEIDKTKPAPDLFDMFGTLTENVVQQRPECGTAMCLAGYVTERYAPSNIERRGESLVDTSTGKEIRHDTLARQILGIDPEQGNDLFDSENSASRIRKVAEQIAGERL